jgi:hypothetical protein
MKFFSGRGDTSSPPFIGLVSGENEESANNVPAETVALVPFLGDPDFDFVRGFRTHLGGSGIEDDSFGTEDRTCHPLTLQSSQAYFRSLSSPGCAVGDLLRGNKSSSSI